MTITADVTARQTRTRWTLADCLASQRCFWLFLALFLIAHLVLRLWETPNIGKNEVQEAVAAQSWAWGYHPRNPPLHTWLLMGSYAVFGVGLLAHAVLKYVLLGAVYGFAYLSGRRLLSSTTLAAVSAASLTLLGPVAWTVHAAWTHTLLLAVCVLATFWAAVRVTQRRTLTDYLVFGVMIGLGLLAKYSFLLFLGPLLAAMLLTRGLRDAVLDTRMLLSLAVALLLVAPHAFWMATARFDFVQFLENSEHIDALHSYPLDLALGFGDLAYESMAFLFPLALIFPAFFVLGQRAGPVTPPMAWGRGVTLIPLIAIGLMAANIVVFRATNYEVRYMLCALLMAPLAAFMWLNRREYSEKAVRRVAVFALAVGVLMFGAVAGRALFYHQSCNRCYDEMPFDRLVHAMREDGFSSGTIVTPDYYTGGNMRLAFPAARITAVNYFVNQPLAADGRCILVWNARIDGDAVPEPVNQYLAHLGAAPPPVEAIHYVEALLRRDRTRMDRFAFVTVEGADASCRPNP